MLRLLAKPNAKLLDLNIHDGRNGNTLLHYRNAWRQVLGQVAGRPTHCARFSLSLSLVHTHTRRSQWPRLAVRSWWCGACNRGATQPSSTSRTSRPQTLPPTTSCAPTLSSVRAPNLPLSHTRAHRGMRSKAEERRVYAERQQMIAAADDAAGAASSDGGQGGPLMEGAIEQWSNYATGWRSRWLAIEHGSCVLPTPMPARTRGCVFGWVLTHTRVPGAQGCCSCTSHVRMWLRGCRRAPCASQAPPSWRARCVSVCVCVCVGSWTARQISDLCSHCAGLQDDRRCFLLRGRNAATSYTFRAASEPVRAQWLRKLAQAGRGPLAHATAAGRRASSGSHASEDESAGAAILPSPSDMLLASPSAPALPGTTAPGPASAAAAVTAGEPAWSDTLDTFLTNLRYQRQAVERMLREAASLVNGDERLVQLRCVFPHRGNVIHTGRDREGGRATHRMTCGNLHARAAVCRPLTHHLTRAAPATTLPVPRRAWWTSYPPLSAPPRRAVRPMPCACLSL
jgi:hypothetical protein